MSLLTSLITSAATGSIRDDLSKTIARNVFSVLEKNKIHLSDVMKTDIEKSINDSLKKIHIKL